MSGKCTLIIASVLLSLMLIAVFLNAFYIKNAAEQILLLIDSSEEAEDNCDSVLLISEYWNGCTPVLRLSLSQKEIEDISLDISEAMICAQNKDHEEYKILMARLRRAIEGIKNREKFSLENIF